MLKETAMRVILRWREQFAGQTRPPRLQRLDALLQRAAATAYYRRRDVALPECGPGEEGFLQQCLAGVPKLELNGFLAEPAALFNWNHSQRPAHRLECPLRQTGRTAVLSGDFAEAEQTRVFPIPTWEEIEEYEPESLAGPVPGLMALAEAALAGRFRLPSLRNAVIPFTGLKHGCLRQQERDLLWRAFELPVFEQFRGFSQELLAWECEAHEGLHIEEDNAIFETATRDRELLLTCLGCEEYALLRLGTHLTARLDAAPCGCGHPAPRLVGLRTLPARPLAMSAHA